MNSSLVVYLIFVAVLVVLAVVAGRIVRRRTMMASKPSTTAAPAWISRRPEHLEPGVEYCELRADFNYNQVTPATSRVTATYFSLAETRQQVLAQAMTEREFDQQRAGLRREGWVEAYTSADREGKSHYFRRA